MAPLVWLITGCSSGLGLALAEAILVRGDFVIATARNPHAASPGLAAVSKHPNTTLLAFDVLWSQSNIDSTFAEALKIHQRIDVLVNNAGYIQTGALEQLSVEDWRSQFETNVFGAIKATKAVLPIMRKQEAVGQARAWVVFIGSLSGWVGHDCVGAYAASKHALEGKPTFIDDLFDLPISQSSVCRIRAHTNLKMPGLC